jgi:hypothetical protein
MSEPIMRPALGGLCVTADPGDLPGGTKIKAVGGPLPPHANTALNMV